MWRLMHTVEEVRGGEDIAMMSPTYVTYTHDMKLFAELPDVRKKITKQTRAANDPPGCAGG